jgi:hypothetical protein
MKKRQQWNKETQVWEEFDEAEREDLLALEIKATIRQLKDQLQEFFMSATQDVTIAEVLVEAQALVAEVQAYVAGLPAAVQGSLVNTNINPADQANLDAIYADIGTAAAALKSIQQPVSSAVAATGAPAPQATATGVVPAPMAPVSAVTPVAPVGVPVGGNNTVADPSATTASAPATTASAPATPGTSS